MCGGHHAAGGKEAGNERIGTDFVLVCLEFLVVDIVDGFGELVLCRFGESFFLGQESDKHAVVVLHQALEVLVHHVYVDHLGELVEKLFLEFNSGSGNIVDEQAHIFLAVGFVLAALALVEDFIDLRDELAAGTLVFTHSETGAVGTQYLAVCFGESLHHILVLGNYIQGEGAFCLGKEEVANRNAGLRIIAFRSLGKIAQSCVEHHRRHALKIFNHVVHLGVAHLAGEQYLVALEEHHHVGHFHFGIRADGVYGAGGVVNFEIHTLGCVGWHGDWCE